MPCLVSLSWKTHATYDTRNVDSIPVAESAVSKRIVRSTCIGQVPKPVGHGLNLGGLPGSSSPPDRFVRSFYLREFASAHAPILSDRDAISLATGILNNVHIVRGTVASGGVLHGDPGFEFTQWSVVKSPQARTFLCEVDFTLH